MSVLGELLEEESEKGIDVLAGSYGVADRASAVGVASIDRLVKEDHGSIRVPRVRVMDDIQLPIDRGRAQLKEETCQRAASRSAIKP